MIIEKYEVKEKDVNEYIDHLNKENKKPIQEWENKRKELHDRILNSLKLNRISKKSREFSKIFDKYCELKIKSLTEIFAKRISNCDTKEEMEIERKKFEFIQKWNKKGEKK